MENYRIILLLGIAFITFWLFDTWEKDHNQIINDQTKQAQGIKTPQANNPDGADTPTANSGTNLDGPSAAPSGEPTAAAEGTVTPVAAGNTTAGQRVSVTTDVYDLVISAKGGDFRQMKLLGYPISVENQNKFELLSERGQLFHVVGSGLMGTSADKQPLPKAGNANYRVEKTKYALADGADTLDVPLFWQSANLDVKRIYRFKRGSYEVEVIDEITNRSNKVQSLSQYGKITRNTFAPEPAGLIPTYTGANLLVGPTSNQKFLEVDFDEFTKAYKQHEGNVRGWGAMVEHYFMSALIPDPELSTNIWTKKSGNRYLLGFTSDAQQIAPGASKQFAFRMFLGPKIAEKLKATGAERMENTIDFGVLSFIAKPLFWVMNKIHSVVGNWGIAIILITLLIKLLFYKLSEAQYRSMAKMRRFAPKIKQIRDRYSDDRQRQSQAMMDLYRKEKFNPFGGCLPVLVQIPVFIALYYMLFESVELRQATFLWLQDLSEPDPYFILPVLFGGAMFIQQRMTMASAAMDPMQAKVMTFMPLMFAVMSLWFPSGLVLYWVVNTLLGMFQQWFITRRVEAEFADGKKA